MPIPSFPAQGSTSWYGYGQGLDTTVRGRAELAAVSTGNTAAQNSTAIQSALTAAASTGAETIVPAGTYNFEGVTPPTAGHFTLRGNGRGRTILQNTHASNASVKAYGLPGGSSYCSHWTLSDLTLSATAVRTGQVGLNIELATLATVRDVNIEGHETGIKNHAAWDMNFDSIELRSCTTGFWFAAPGIYTTSTPVYCRSVSAMLCGTGALLDGGVEVLTWVGGDFSGSGTGAVINENSSRNITFVGVNFEGITTTDVVIGTTGSPTAVNLIGCRFFRSASTGATSIHHINASDVFLLGGTWNNYGTAIRQESTAWTLFCQGASNFGVTTFLDVNGTTYPYSPSFIATPYGTTLLGVNEASTFAKIGVGNSATATTLGTLSRKMEVFNQAGTSIGFVPIYTTIT